jgi:hypothetical protein
MISQAYVSPTLETTFGENFRSLWSLKKYEDKNSPAVFFGLYTATDLHVLESHNAPSIVIWGGGDMRKDSLELVSKMVSLGKTFTFAYPGEFSNILTSYNIDHKKLYIPIKSYSDFELCPLGEKIYVYRGVKGTRSSYFQWEEVIKPLISYFGEDSFIYTDNLPVSELIEGFYKNCFVYVKPTPKGGCTAMFELGHMGRKTIGTGLPGLPNFIEYRGFSQLTRLIKNESKKIGTLQPEVREATSKIFCGPEWLDLSFWKK